MIGVGSKSNKAQQKLEGENGIARYHPATLFQQPVMERRNSSLNRRNKYPGGFPVTTQVPGFPKTRQIGRREYASSGIRAN